MMLKSCISTWFEWWWV